MGKHDPKLNNEQKLIIIKMLGAWIKVHEIVKYFKFELDVQISYDGVYWYKKHKLKEIDEATEEWKRNLECIPLANKFKRILARAALVEDLQKKLWLRQKTAYGKKYVGSHNHINNILDSIQMECEPAKIALTDPTGDYEYKGEQSEDERAERIIGALRAIRDRQLREGIISPRLGGNGSDDLDTSSGTTDSGGQQ